MKKIVKNYTVERTNLLEKDELKNERGKNL